MIKFHRTRNIDLIEDVGNRPDIIAGSNNGDGFDYNPEHTYYAVECHGQFAGIIYCHEIQPMSWDCHAMYVTEMRGFGKEIGMEFWRMLLEITNVACVTSYASEKFRNGQIYCTMVGMKRVGTIPKYFKGADDVTFYAATREELVSALSKYDLARKNKGDHIC